MARIAQIQQQKTCDWCPLPPWQGSEQAPTWTAVYSSFRNLCKALFILEHSIVLPQSMLVQAALGQLAWDVKAAIFFKKQEFLC